MLREGGTYLGISLGILINTFLYNLRDQSQEGILGSHSRVLRARSLVPNKHVRDLLVLLSGNGVQDACTCSIESGETGIALGESFISGDNVQEVVLLFIPFLEISL